MESGGKLHQRRMLDMQHTDPREDATACWGRGSIVALGLVAAVTLLSFSQMVWRTSDSRAPASDSARHAHPTLQAREEGLGPGDGMPLADPHRLRPGIVTASVLNPCRPSAMSTIPAAVIDQLCLLPRQKVAARRHQLEADRDRTTVTPGGGVLEGRVLSADEEEAAIMADDDNSKAGITAPALAAFGRNQSLRLRRQIQGWTVLLAAKEATARRAHGLDTANGDGLSTARSPSQMVGPIQCCQPSQIASFMNM